MQLTGLDIPSKLHEYDKPKSKYYSSNLLRSSFQTGSIVGWEALDNSDINRTHNKTPDAFPNLLKKA